MSHQTRTIVLASIAVIVAASLIAINPSIIGDAQAQMYANDYGYDSNYNSYSEPKNSFLTDIQKIKCVNSNINVNGIDITQIPQESNGLAATEAANEDEVANTQQNGNGGLGDRLNVEKNLVNICANLNSNDQLKVEEPATLTVNKEIFGCDNFDVLNMGCDQLNDSPDWLPCIGSSISSSIYCQGLPPNLFDIEVLDNQNTQIQQFEGSTAGTTIQNLQPGTYTVNEIKHTDATNQLGADDLAQQRCTATAGFSDGGLLSNTVASIVYGPLCFEYEDEQGNDCSTVTLAAGEHKTCTVKNYIRLAVHD